MLMHKGVGGGGGGVFEKLYTPWKRGKQKKKKKIFLFEEGFFF